MNNGETAAKKIMAPPLMGLRVWWQRQTLGKMVTYRMGFSGGSVVKNPPANSGDTRDSGLIPQPGRSPGVGNGNPL